MKVEIQKRILERGGLRFDAAHYSLNVTKPTNWVIVTGDASMSGILKELERMAGGRWGLWVPAYLPGLQENQMAYPALHEPDKEPLYMDLKVYKVETSATYWVAARSRRDAFKAWCEHNEAEGTTDEMFDEILDGMKVSEVSDEEARSFTINDDATDQQQPLVYFLERQNGALPKN